MTLTGLEAKTHHPPLALQEPKQGSFLGDSQKLGKTLVLIKNFTGADQG